MLVSLDDIFRGEKRAGKVSWGEVSPYHDEFEAPLQLLPGAILEGLRLRVRAATYAPERDYTVQLEYCPAGNRGGGQIDRIDWNPDHIHNNHDRGPAELRQIIIDTSHHHTFEWNWYQPENRMLRKNLPVAVLLENVENSKQLLQYAAIYYKIENLVVPDRPQRQGSLFQGI
jgi:hypothetical protein